MGAKQSKRSVDISGKEAEGAGEVAAAGAGGEGRVEAIADLDNLKPQLNGDAQHIEPIEEKTEKEKQLDSGTPENEKDATTEKETEAEPKDAPLTNGESEHKPEAEKENGETPAPEEAKKPKKEKVKKKWSLRSISFSRKDKPKHEKKEKKDKKDDDGKTNGDAEKVPEEAAEATEVATESVATEETKPAESKEQQTPETPVTEPITNGTSTPESPKVESPAEPAPQLNDRPETKTVTEPEQLALNGLSLEESKKEVTEVAETVESITEELVAPAPETPAKTEVCVERMNSIESTPPPLPANPPPSSVASFAASTMAPELTDASLITTNPAPTADTIAEAEAPIQTQDIISKTEALITESPIPTEPIVNVMSIKDEVVTETVKLDEELKTESIVINDAPEIENLENALENKTIEVRDDDVRQTELLNGLGIETVAINDTPIHNNEPVVAVTVENIIESANDPIEEESAKSDIAIENIQATIEDVKTEVIINDIAEQNGVETVAVALQNGDHITNGNHFTNGIESDKLNGDATETEEENIKNKTKEVTKEVELNGSFDDSAKIVVKAAKIIDEVIAIATDAEDMLPPPLDEDIEGEASSEEERSLPPPPPSQEIIPSHDKLADLIPEVPELPTETVQETTSDVAVAN